MSRRVAKRDPKLNPMPETKALLHFQREFSFDEYQQISFGLISQVMEDKWLIFLENDWLYFHRSWTGFCIYQLRLESANGRYLVAEAWVNRDQNQYRQADDDYDEALLSFLIDNFLLGKRTPFPVPINLPENVPKGLYQHSVSGSGYPEVEMSKKDEDS